MSANALKDAVAEVDQQVAGWLEGLANQLARARELYWRGEMSNVVWHMHLDASVREMRDVAHILRSRPISTEAKR